MEKNTIDYKGHKIEEYEKDFYIVHVENDYFKLHVDWFGRVERIQFLRFPESREELLSIIRNIEFLDAEYLCGTSVPSVRSGILFSYKNPFISSKPVSWNAGKNQIGEYQFREGLIYGSGSSSEYASSQFYTSDMSSVNWMPTLGVKTTLKKEELSKRLGLDEWHEDLLVHAYEHAGL